MRVKITPVAINNFPFVEKGLVKYMDNSLPGFGVRVTANSKAFFIVFGKERRSKTIGKYPAMSLKQARMEAMRLQRTFLGLLPKPAYRASQTP